MSNKHDANVRKSTLVNFQIGLIASLLFTYVMFEVSTAEKKIAVIPEPEPIEDLVVEWNGDFRVEVETKPKPIVKKRIAKVVSPPVAKIVPSPIDIAKLGEDVVKPTSDSTASFDPSTLHEVDDPDNTAAVEVSFVRVEDVPVFPGCEDLKTNREKAACFNEKIRRIVARKFNGDLGAQYGLKGKLRIDTAFDVASDGTIQNVRIRAPHPKLEKEARRVIGLFPTMTPGMQRKRPVTVKYNLPIMFKVED